ncbi:MAG: hypothetical protein ACE5E2_05055 [Candidatus Binatia bacterium]
MARCAHCGDRAGLWSKICRDCKKLRVRAGELHGRVGYGEFLNGLEETGVSPQKIMAFLKADPDGKGSLQDQVTAEMANELLTVMGIRERQTPEDVKRIRKTTKIGSK